MFLRYLRPLNSPQAIITGTTIRKAETRRFHSVVSRAVLERADVDGRGTVYVAIQRTGRSIEIDTRGVRRSARINCR